MRADQAMLLARRLGAGWGALQDCHVRQSQHRDVAGEQSACSCGELLSPEPRPALTCLRAGPILSVLLQALQSLAGSTKDLLQQA